MQSAVHRVAEAEVIIMAAAVADFRPSNPAIEKIKKADGEVPAIPLEKTHDFLVDLGTQKPPGQVLVGFAAETQDVLANARGKLERKNLDLIVANDVSSPGAGFGHDTNKVTILSIDASDVDVPMGSKRDVAESILDAVVGPPPTSRVGHIVAPPSASKRSAVQPPGDTPVPKNFSFTSESVTEGHPDKMADQISDSILDAFLEQDPDGTSRLRDTRDNGTGHRCGRNHDEVVNTSTSRPSFARPSTGSGTTGSRSGSTATRVASWWQSTNNPQTSPKGVTDSEEVRSGSTGEEDELDKQGAGDQGMMFGYASGRDRRTHADADSRGPPDGRATRCGAKVGNRSISSSRDGKTQVTFEYEDNKPVRLQTVLVSTQHNEGIDRDSMIRPDLIENVIKPVIPEQFADDDYAVHINPTGRFVIGGPVGDAGLTGRKIIVDTYGGMGRHGGGAFSGKDPSKVDRSGAYATRWVAKNLVASGAATRCEVQVAYAIGMARPMSVFIETFGTETVDPVKIADAVDQVFDLRPAAILRDLDLRRPVFTPTATYGHFGRSGDGFTWENTDRADDLKRALDL